MHDQESVDTFQPTESFNSVDDTQSNGTVGTNESQIQPVAAEVEEAGTVGTNESIEISQIQPVAAAVKEVGTVQTIISPINTTRKRYTTKKTKKTPLLPLLPQITEKIMLKELDFDMIRPNLQSIGTTAGGSKITMIGKPMSGKSVLIKALLAAKQHIIPVGTVISGTESTNHFYQSLFPSAFIHEEFKLSIIENVRLRQKHAMANLPNPWAVLILDDCMDDVKIFNHPTMSGLMKNSRHWSLLTIISTQYCLDFKPVIRTNIDGIFIFREANIDNRQKLYKNFASIIPTFELFTQIMNEMTGDHTCLYIHNNSFSNNWQDCCFYILAPMVPDFKFGCSEFWGFSDERCKQELK